MESEKGLIYYWEVLKKRWAIVIIMPLIAMLASGIISFFFSPKPVYVATTTLVMGKPTESVQETDKVDLSAILASPQMAKIFEPVVKSRNVEEKVINQLNLPLSVAQLNSKVTVISMQDSDLIAINVTDYNAKLAADIANVFAEKFAQVVIEIKRVNNVSVLDRAVTPDTPINNTNKKQNMLYAFLIGLMFALGLAYLLDYFDNTLKNSEDIQKTLDLPVIGKIPFDSEVTLSNSKSPVAEAYRTLRTNIQFLNFDYVKKRILITSTGPSEGKSIIAVNLAISLVQTGKSVLIIDANLRNPIQHKLFELTSEEGLSSTLVSDSPSLGQIVQTRIQGLSLFTAGSVPPNPAELLASDNMKSILTDAAAAYDVVIIDSPPTVAIADVSILAQVVDGVILVVGSGEVSREYALEAKEQLEMVEAKIIGVVLNKVNLKTKDYKYRYHFHEGSSNWKKKRFKRSKFRNSANHVAKINIKNLTTLY